VQILHPFEGSVHQYAAAITDVDRYRPDHCPQCAAAQPLRGHGCYRRTLVDRGFDGLIRVRRYLCLVCKQTLSLLPAFALPWWRFSLTVIARFLVARLLQQLTLVAAAGAAGQPTMPYQRGQVWVRRFRKQAPTLGLALAPLVRPQVAVDAVTGALASLERVGWIPAHRFLFSELRAHLLGWPASLASQGRRVTLAPAPRAG
jgi:hypothetical protein